MIRTWLGREGFFSLDDYVFYTRATQSHLWNHDFIMTPYNGHLMPGAMAWVWISSKVAPLNYHVVLGTMMALQALAGVLMFVLLRILFGNRWAILVPLAVFSFTTVTLPAAWWWAAGLNQLPQQISMLLVLVCHVLYVRAGHRLMAFAGPLALILGLLFSEKTALVIPLIALITWLFFSEGTLFRSLLTAIRRYWLTWVAYLAVLIPYVVYYLTNVPDESRGKPTTVGLVELFDTVIRKSVMPGLLGGPWRWEPVGFVDGGANPHPIAQILAAILVSAVVVLSILHSRTAVKSWAIAGLYLAVLILLAASTRGLVIAPEAVGSEYRYITDFALVAALCGALAFLPVHFTPLHASGRETFANEAQIPSFYGGLHLPSLVTAAVVALVASSTYSAHQFAERWSASPSKTYVSNAIRTMEALAPGDRIYNGIVPDKVVWQLLYPANLPTSLLGPLGLKSMPLKIGESTGRLRQFNINGELEDSRVTGIYPRIFETPDCLVEVSNKPREIPLSTRTFEWPWTLQIDFTADNPGILNVKAGTTRTTARIDPDVETVYIAVEGGFDSVTLSAPGNEFCIKYLAVGAPQPNDW